MSADTASLVWYVSYGSNLLAERFAAYLEGGVPEGRVLPQQGARDPRRWRDDRPVMLPHRLGFQGVSKGWGGGGVAFIDPSVAQPLTRGRAYLITAEQFQDVLAQESGREVGTEVDLGEALEVGQAHLGQGRYDLVIHLGAPGGWPAFTFTTPTAPQDLDHNPPNEAYRSTIARGLQQSHGLSAGQADDYLVRWSTPGDG